MSAAGSRSADVTRRNSVSDNYKEAGVDVVEADKGLQNIIGRITGTWPPAGAFGTVQLPIGYFANVIDIGGVGLAISTDGVGSKAIVAQMVGKYDTIGIDCVAMNVNDLLCVGARPVSMVDYIATDRADAAMLDGIAIGLAEGARQAGVSITGGEISQLPEVVHGFDLVGTAIGIVPLDRILIGRELAPGDVVIGMASNGLHSNGFTLARRVLFDRAGLAADRALPELGHSVGEELLRPTAIYVSEILDLLEQVPTIKALIHVTGDGLLNLPRVAAKIGMVIENMPEPPPIFPLLERLGGITRAEMFAVFNMGVGFCVMLPERDVDAALAVLARQGRQAWAIGRIVADPTGSVRLPREKLVGRGKRFVAE